MLATASLAIFPIIGIYRDDLVAEEQNAGQPRFTAPWIQKIRA
jgi:hypothetical protein